MEYYVRVIHFLEFRIIIQIIWNSYKTVTVYLHKYLINEVIIEENYNIYYNNERFCKVGT